MDKRIEKLVEEVWRSLCGGEGRIEVAQYLEKAMDAAGLQIVAKPTPEREALDKARDLVVSWARCWSSTNRATYVVCQLSNAIDALEHLCDQEAAKQGILKPRAPKPPPMTLEEFKRKTQVHIRGHHGEWYATHEKGKRDWCYGHLDRAVNSAYGGAYADYLREHEAGK